MSLLGMEFVHTHSSYSIEPQKLPSTCSYNIRSKSENLTLKMSDQMDITMSDRRIRNLTITVRNCLNSTMNDFSKKNINPGSYPDQNVQFVGETAELLMKEWFGRHYTHYDFGEVNVTGTIFDGWIIPSTEDLVYSVKEVNIYFLGMSPQYKEGFLGKKEWEKSVSKKLYMDYVSRLEIFLEPVQSFQVATYLLLIQWELVKWQSGHYTEKKHLLQQPDGAFLSIFPPKDIFTRRRLIDLETERWRTAISHVFKDDEFISDWSTKYQKRNCVKCKATDKHEIWFKKHLSEDGNNAQFDKLLTKYHEFRLCLPTRVGAKKKSREPGAGSISQDRILYAPRKMKKGRINE